MTDKKFTKEIYNKMAELRKYGYIVTSYEMFEKMCKDKELLDRASDFKALWVVYDPAAGPDGYLLILDDFGELINEAWSFLSDNFKEVPA